ncbi:MAG: GNAT family N-acetyltransferase [Armatimonadetes bacterium]|nr:GNAT family N-acetyltransferase [Armatimonadota bacterium]
MDRQQPGDRGDHRGAPAIVEYVSAVERLDALAAAWNALATSDPGAHVFQGHAWLSTWLRHRPRAQPVILVARRGDRLTAALPLCAHDAGRRPVRLRTLRFLADSESDSCAALSDPSYPEDLAALWQALLRRRDWHLVDLRYLPSGSPLTSLIEAAGHGLHLDSVQHDVAPYLDITTDWRETVPKSQRPKLLRRRRQLQETGATRFDVAASDEEVDLMLEQLAAMHIARWRGRHETSIFLLPERRAWLRQVCHELLKRGELYLCRLALDGQPVSLGIYYLSGRRLVNTIYSFDEAFRKYGPVHLLVIEVIEDARTRGLADAHDFGRGAEEYKMRWTQDQQPLLRVLAARRTLAGSAAFWWAARAKPFLWRHYALSTAIREARRRLEARRRAKPEPGIPAL